MNADKEKRMLSTERLARLDSEKLISRLNLAGDETLVDAGAGPGAFAFQFARALSNGRVYAVDIDEALLKSIAIRAEAENIDNIRPINAEQMNIPEASADIVFCCTVLHEVPEKDAFLADYFRLLKPGGRIYIVEFASGKRTMDADDTGTRAFIPAKITQEMLEKAGFSAVSSEQINPIIYLCYGEKAS